MRTVTGGRPSLPAPGRARTTVARGDVMPNTTCTLLSARAEVPGARDMAFAVGGVNQANASRSHRKRDDTILNTKEARDHVRGTAARSSRELLVEVAGERRRARPAG